ncbi:MAG: hypothetical protein ACJ8CR_14540 [Roseiflexaceae bacterium]
MLGRLGHTPATRHLIGLLTDLTYRDDAREALEALDTSDVLPQLNAQLDARRMVRLYTSPTPAEARYLEAHGDAYSLALLRQTENYHFVARYAGAEKDPLVEAARRLERRLLAESGADPQTIDEPVATIQRILAGPLHPAECVARDVRGALLPDGEQHARWRNLCVALVAWLQADPPSPLDAMLDEAERLLAGFPDALREAHESWWLNVVRGSQIGLPRISAVARAALRPRAPWRLARTLVINEGVQGAIDPAICFGWPDMSSIRILELPLGLNWIKALAHAPAHVAPRRLRVLLGGDNMAQTLAEWPGLERLEVLEVVWSRNLSKAARELLGRRAPVYYLEDSIRNSS